MKQKVFKIGIKHSRSSIPDGPAQKVGQAIKNSLPSIAKRHLSPEGGPTFFCSWPPFSIFRLQSAHYVVLSKNASHRKYFFVKTSFNLYPSMFCVEKNKNVLFLALEFTIFSYATWFLYFDFSPAPFLSSKTSWTTVQRLYGRRLCSLKSTVRHRHCLRCLWRTNWDLLRMFSTLRWAFRGQHISSQLTGTGFEIVLNASSCSLLYLLLPCVDVFSMWFVLVYFRCGRVSNKSDWLLQKLTLTRRTQGTGSKWAKHIPPFYKWAKHIPPFYM